MGILLVLCYVLNRKWHFKVVVTPLRFDKLVTRSFSSFLALSFSLSFTWCVRIIPAASIFRNRSFEKIIHRRYPYRSIFAKHSNKNYYCYLDRVKSLNISQEWHIIQQKFIRSSLLLPCVQINSRLILFFASELTSYTRTWAVLHIGFTLLLTMHVCAFMCMWKVNMNVVTVLVELMQWENEDNVCKDGTDQTAAFENCIFE